MSPWRAEVFDPTELDAADLYDDASVKTALYARLSRNAAEAGDVVIAVAAAWAADVHAVQALWWERARDAGGGPFEPFLAAGAAIATAGELASRSNGTAEASGAPDGAVLPAGVAGRDGPRTARGVVEAARRGLLAAFDPAAAMLVAARLAAVDHLSMLPAPPAPDARPDSAVQAFAARVADRKVGELLDELWTAAVDARVVARALATAGYADDAVAHLVLAETANFEAYLLRVAEAVGDSDLLGADLRRAAFADLLPPLRDLPQELGQARLEIRDVMRSVLGAGELGRFARLLEAYDAAEVVVELSEEVLRPAVVPDPPVVDFVAEEVPLPAELSPALAGAELGTVPVPAAPPTVEFMDVELLAVECLTRKLTAEEIVAEEPELEEPEVEEPEVEERMPVAAAPVLPIAVVPAQVTRMPAPAAAYAAPAYVPAPPYAPNAPYVPAAAYMAGAFVPAQAAAPDLEAEAGLDEIPDVPSGPPVIPPDRPFPHRDIFAQDLNGQGPRMGTLAPRPYHG